MANLNIEHEIVHIFIPSFLEKVVRERFDGERPEDYHDEKRVKARMAEYLKDICLGRPLSLLTILDILEDEQRDCYDSGYGWQGDVALALQASIMIRLKVFEARHSTGVVRKDHMKSARKWRKALDYAGI